MRDAERRGNNWFLGKLLRMTAESVYDIGANNGDDSAFSLAKGFRVVAIEADPVLCAKLRERFADEIESGDCVVENLGVSDSEGLLEFYVNDFSEWSSFVKDGKATSELGHSCIQVRTEPLSRITRRHGAARYLKIDIEGFERQALLTLRPSLPMPQFLSFEVNNDWRRILSKLTWLGYTAFQIVRQGEGILPDAPNPSREGQYVPQVFRNSHSGCFGLDLPDRWRSVGDIRAEMKAVTEAANTRLDRGELCGWHDIHCRFGQGLE